jgi:hypothetical protein
MSLTTAMIKVTTKSALGLNTQIASQPYVFGNFGTWAVERLATCVNKNAPGR